MLSLNQGQELVRIARKAIEYYLATGSYLREISIEKEFNKPGAVFITIKKFPETGLRGCTGFTNATDPLVIATIYCSVNAVTGSSCDALCAG